MAQTGVKIMLANANVTRVAETDEELLSFDVSDDALERASGADDVAGGRFSLVYSTEVAGGCACPV